MLNCMFVSDAKAFLVTTLVAMREALMKRFKTAHLSTLSLAAKLATWIKVDPTGSVVVLMRKWYRDTLSSSTMTTDEVDVRGYFKAKATKELQAKYLSEEKDWKEDDSFAEKVEKLRIKLMSTHTSVQAFVIPIKLKGKVGTVWLVKGKAETTFRDLSPEGCDTLCWSEVVVSEGWEKVGRKLMAVSMVLRLLDIEDGPDSTALFEVDSEHEMTDYIEALQEVEMPEGDDCEAILSDVSKRIKLFDRSVGHDRLEALQNANGGQFARTKSAEDARERGEKSFVDKMAELDNETIFGEQAVSVENLSGQVVEQTHGWKFSANPALEFCVRRLFLEHQTFPQVCRPSTMGKTGFIAGRPFYAEGFGLSRLAVKNGDAYLLFGTPHNGDSVYAKLVSDLKTKGVFLGKDEFKNVLRKRLARLNHGREAWFFGKGLAGETLALKFRKGSDTARLILRMMAFKPRVETIDDRIRSFLDARMVQPVKAKHYLLANAYDSPKG